MNGRWRTATIAFAISLLFAVPTPSFAQLKAITSGGFSAPYRAALPEFAADVRNQGHDVVGRFAGQLAAKTTSTGVAAVARGEAEMAIQPVSELLHVEGTDFVGTLPSDVQFISVFAAAIVQASTEREAARRLIAFLESDRATAIIKNSGMDRPKGSLTAARLHVFRCDAQLNAFESSN